MNLQGQYISTDEEVNFNDEPARSRVKNMLYIFQNIKTEDNTNQKDIDLWREDDHTYRYEVESGSWIDDYWASNQSINRDERDIPYRTLNMPQRKEKYFYKTFPCLTHNGEPYTHFEEHPERNIFIRSNTAGTQFIYATYDTIVNKSIRTRFKTETISTGKIEDWISMKREDCVTINFIDNKYVIDTDPGGKFPPKEVMDEIRRMRIRAVMNGEI
jgi:hypothetical protein